MQAMPVLMVTRDDALWAHWQELANEGGWLPARGHSLQDLTRWQRQSRHLVILDAALPGLPGPGDTAWKTYFQTLSVLVLSARLDDDAGRQLLAQGAFGYAHAYTPVSSLSVILQSIVHGMIWLGPALLRRLLRDVDSRLPKSSDGWTADLTPREQQVAWHAALGDSNIDIAEQLDITERTVRAHLSAVFEKLHVRDRLALALRIHGIAH